MPEPLVESIPPGDNEEVDRLQDYAEEILSGLREGGYEDSVDRTLEVLAYVINVVIKNSDSPNQSIIGLFALLHSYGLLPQ